MKKYYIFLLVGIQIAAVESKTIFTTISNYSDQFYLMIQTDDKIVHTLKPSVNNQADTVEIPLTFNWDNDFYKASLTLGYYNFENPEEYVIRPFCIEKIVLHLTKKQVEDDLQFVDVLDLNINTSLLWKVATLGWGTCFAIYSNNLKTFSSLNYPEHTHLKRDDYTYEVKSN